ncbi:response regulator [Bradyrhizobium sp. AZCC 2230]|uniref:response regulator n=1 Tax=Bradyrhizobium sp. AZCC 2230 TaxID=3117021 RepID=UPI002FF015E8
MYAANKIAKNALRESTKMGYVLIVDDDPAMRGVLTRYFEEHSQSTIAVSGRASLDRHLAAAEPCLILLDLQLDQEDGLDTLREIRSRSDVPIIVMTGHRLEEVDRVIGLELGADDYILKPFGLRELLARVKAVLRRQEMGRLARERDPDRGGYKFEGWSLERRRRLLIDPAGASISLSKSEFALLIAFLDASQRPLTREYLLQATRMHEDIFDRSVDVQVFRLRRKLELNPSTPKMIATERGIGYVFTATVERY